MLNQDKFTYRDTRKLKKLLKDQAKGKITMEKILEQFPGKTEDQVVEFQKLHGLI